MGKIGVGGQGARVLGAVDLLDHRQQGGELVAGPGRVTRLPGPEGQVVPGGQEGRILGAERPGRCVMDSLLEFQGGAVAAAPAKVVHQTGHPVAVIGKGCLGVRQQRRARRPDLWQGGVAGDRCLDQDGGGGSRSCRADARRRAAAQRDGLWAIAGVDVYRLLTELPGWTPEEYQAWLAGVFARLLGP